MPEVTDIVREHCWHLHLDLSPDINDLLTEIKEISCYCGKIENCIIILLRKNFHQYTSLKKKGNDSLQIGFINTFDDWLSCFCNTQQFRKCLSEDIFIPLGYKWKYLSKRLAYKFSWTVALIFSYTPSYWTIFSSDKYINNVYSVRLFTNHTKHSPIQHIFIEPLLWVRHCAKY